MEQVGSADYVVATYEEIRLRFGLGGTDQARIKAKRRKWLGEPPNHPGAVTRIRVPRDAWEAAAAEVERARSRGSAPPEIDQSYRNKALIDAVAAFREVQERSGEREARLLGERDAALAELGEQRTRAAAAEAALTEVRDALAREIRQAEQAEAARKGAETQAGAALASRDAMQAELDAWTSGGPLARMWRAFWHRHKALPWR